MLLCHSSFADTNSGPVAIAADIQDADCIDFINENPARVRCGFIDLPVNHNNPAAGKVTLPILIAGQTRSMSSSSSDRAILIPGGGGPGASIGFGPAYRPGEYLGIYESLRAAGFDLIILDQRGAGFAKPSLRCPETIAAFKDSIGIEMTFTKAMEGYHDALISCKKTLEARHITLNDFDTYQSARDFLAVIDLLQYDWWGTLATSYATAITQTMQVIRPEVFQQVVLDSPVAIDFQRPFTFELTETSLLRILSLCEITRRCNKRHRDIKSKFKTVLARTKAEPFMVEIKVNDGGSDTTTVPFVVSDTTLLDMLMIAAYSNYTITEIPWIIDELYKNKTHKLNELATDYWYYNTDPEFATALSWTVHCKERQPLEEQYLHRNPTAAGSHSQNTTIAIEKEKSICRQWRGSIDDSYSALLPPPQFTSQTLIVAGDLDPVISREDINHTADNFTDKKIMILPGTGHSVWFQSQCVRNTVVDFFTLDANLTTGDCKDGITRFK